MSPSTLLESLHEAIMHRGGRVSYTLENRLAACRTCAGHLPTCPVTKTRAMVDALLCDAPICERWLG